MLFICCYQIDGIRQLFMRFSILEETYNYGRLMVIDLINLRYLF